MKSRLIVLIFMLLVSAGAILLILSDQWSTVDGSFEGMILKSPETIDQIEVIGSIDTLVLRKHGSRWQFPDDEVLNHSSIESILYTASNFRVLSIISSEKILDYQDYVTVNFSKGKRLNSSFILLMLSGRPVIYTEGGENAYLVELPGYSDLSVEKVFSPNPNHYRDHLLINLLPKEISTLKVSPLKGTGFSVRQDTSAVLKVMNIENEEVFVEERKIRLLLSYFVGIRYEAFLPQEKISVDFDLSNPAAQIQISDIQGNTNELLIFPWIKKGEESPDLYNALVIHNNGPQILLVNYTYLDLLIRSLENYLPGK